MNVHQLIERHNGQLVWSFSQDEDYVLDHLKAANICVPLSAHWIRYHSQNDSLVNHLDPNRDGAVNTGLLQYMSVLRSFLNPDFVGLSYANLALFLQMHGLLPLYSSYDQTILSFPDGDNSPQLLDTLHCRKERFVREKKYNMDIECSITRALKALAHCYACVSFDGSEYGHMTAAWIGGSNQTEGDACYFDPNFGEIWFKRRQDFFAFYPEYYRKRYKGYGFVFGWRVYPCAPVK